MAEQKFTVILIPDEDGYQVVVPHFPTCTTWGKTPREAFDNAKEAMELILEEPTEAGMYALELPNDFHVIVGDVDVEVPDPVTHALEKTPADTSA